MKSHTCFEFSCQYIILFKTGVKTHVFSAYFMLKYASVPYNMPFYHQTLHIWSMFSMLDRRIISEFTTLSTFF